MHELDWLIGLRFISVVRREFDWIFNFDDNVRLTTECLWRLIEDGHIAVTSSDDGHKFGLPDPLNAEAEVNSRLANAVVKNISVSSGVLDLSIDFGTKYSVQVVPDSSGYEAWNLGGRNHLFVAAGGGQLVIFKDGVKTR